jgi:hypothetical protein
MTTFEGIPPFQGGGEWAPRVPSRKNKRGRASGMFSAAQGELPKHVSKERRFTKSGPFSPHDSSDKECFERTSRGKRTKREESVEEGGGRSVRRQYPKEYERPVADPLGELVGPDLVFFKECVFSLKHNRQIFPQLVADPRMNPIVAKRLLQIPMIEDATPQTLRRLAERMSGSLQEGVRLLSQSEWGTQRVGLLATLCVTADTLQEQEALTWAVADRLVQTGNVRAERAFVGNLPETIRPTPTITARSREELDDVIARLADLSLGRRAY